MPRQSPIVKKKSQKKSPKQRNPAITRAIKPSKPSPQRPPHWWESPTLSVRVMCAEEGSHIQVVETATGCVEGTLAVVNATSRTHVKAEELASLIADDLDLLDGLAGKPGIIDRRRSRPGPDPDPDPNADADADWSEVDRLYELAAKNCHPGDSPIIVILANALIQPGCNARPDAKSLTHARAEFYALPIQDQQRILNGWNPEPNRQSRAALNETYRSSAIKSVLALDILYEAQEIFAGRQFEFYDSTSPATVRIQCGATQQEAMQCLRWCMKNIEENWSELIAGKSRFYSHAQDAPQPAPATFTPSVAGITPEAFDAHFVAFRALAAKLGFNQAVSVSSAKAGLVLPDGTVRDLHEVLGADTNPLFAIAGRGRKPG